MSIVDLWDWHWFNIVSTAVAILGTIYISCNYLDKRFIFLKKFSHGIALGLVVAFIFGLIHFLTDLVSLLTNTYNISSDPYSQLFMIYHNPFLLSSGFLFGFLISISYCVAKKSLEKIWVKIAVLCLIVILILNFFQASNSSDQNQFSYALTIVNALINLSGFLSGLIIAQLRSLSLKNFALCFLGLCLLMLSVVSQDLTSSISIFLYWGFPAFVIGLTVDKSLSLNRVSEKISDTTALADEQYKKSGKSELERPDYLLLVWLYQTSWQAFLAWLFVGFLFGLFLLPFLEYTSFAIIFLTLGIINGQGHKLIKRIKPKYRFGIKDNTLSPIINFPRFLIGFLVGFLYMIAFQMFDIIYSFIHLINNDVGSVYFIKYTLIDLIGCVYPSLIIGLIYGFGQYIIYKIDNMNERTLSRIGIIMTLLGIIISTLTR